MADDLCCRLGGVGFILGGRLGGVACGRDARGGGVAVDLAARLGGMAADCFMVVVSTCTVVAIVCFSDWSPCLSCGGCTAAFCGICVCVKVGT